MRKKLDVLGLRLADNDLPDLRRRIDSSLESFGALLRDLLYGP